MIDLNLNAAGRGIIFALEEGYENFMCFCGYYAPQVF